MSKSDQNLFLQMPNSREGLMSRLVKKFLLREGNIAKIKNLGVHFLRISLEGNALKNVPRVPGVRAD